ncbi:hypothetical protein ACHWQZ_G016257 [Mnemiopsis leidyi]
MSRLSQEIWKHGIDPLEGLNEDTEDLNNVDQDQLTDHDIERPADSLMNRDEVRYSFTFRHVAPFFKNSTVIVGDSNTKYIKFGKDAGTLGKWLPGKRMWAAKIGDIPSPKDIGPYRNIVIHSGINDIRDDFNRASNRALIGQLKRKCDDIQKLYPNAKLHLSLLLPTKSPHVNVRVRELNSLFIDFVFNRNNMFVIDNSVLGTQNGCMPSKYGDFNIDLLSKSKDAAEFEQIIYSNNLIPLISVATHVKPGCNETLIDNILVNSTEDILAAGILESKVSHHSPTFCFISCITDKDANASVPKHIPKFQKE